MTKACLALAALLAVSLAPVRLTAQQNSESADKNIGTTLKVQLTFTESEGEKKLTNLPYTFFVRATEGKNGPPPWTKVRVGSRVPVRTGNTAQDFNYMDVNTNIDARAFTTADGRYDIYLNLERSWIEGDVEGAGKNPSGEAIDSKRPIVRQFKTELTFAMRDGQTVQTTQAPDPLSGRILGTTVTMNVVK